MKIATIIRRTKSRLKPETGSAMRIKTTEHPPLPTAHLTSDEAVYLGGKSLRPFSLPPAKNGTCVPCRATTELPPSSCPYPRVAAYSPELDAVNDDPGGWSPMTKGVMSLAQDISSGGEERESGRGPLFFRRCRLLRRTKKQARSMSEMIVAPAMAPPIAAPIGKCTRRVVGDSDDV